MPTVNCQLRLDARDLVVLMEWGRSVGLPLQIGAVLRVQLEALSKSLDFTRPESIEEAVERLSQLGVSAEQLTSKKSRVIKEMAKETLAEALAQVRQSPDMKVFVEKALREHDGG